MKQPMTTAQLRQTQLAILQQFHQVCEENHLRYSLAFGSLLGAVRHQGFIPWDDDIDVCMPREDYEKLLSLQYDNGRYAVKNYRYSKQYYYVFTKMIDKNTTLTEPSRAETEMGVCIDIFPIDNLPKQPQKLQKLFKKSRRNRYIIDHLGARIFYQPAFSLRFIAKLILRALLLPFQKVFLRYADTCMSRFPKSENGACMIYGTYGENEVFPLCFFDNRILMEFEKERFYAFQEYNTYLTHLFGDYMTPPPKEEQITHHHFQAYEK